MCQGLCTCFRHPYHLAPVHDIVNALIRYGTYLKDNIPTYASTERIHQIQSAPYRAVANAVVPPLLRLMDTVKRFVRAFNIAQTEGSEAAIRDYDDTHKE
jgi:hypothetical protein